MTEILLLDAFSLVYRAFFALPPMTTRRGEPTGALYGFYVRTYEGWIYLAVVIDLFSRRVVGWSIQASLHTDIVLSALTMAVGQRFAGTRVAPALRLVYRRSWPTRREAVEAIHEYVEVFYNRRRRRTTLGGKPPAVFEALAERQLTQAA